MDPILGQIILAPFNFAPVGWAVCDGSLLPIQQYAALFSLIGTTYGGDGRTNFALPDLRGRIPVGQGAGPGLTPITLGAHAGVENVTLTTNQIPAHGHNVTVTIPATAKAGTSQSPANLVPALTADSLGANVLAYGASDGTTHLAAPAPTASALTGGGQPVGIRNPYLGLQYLIAMQGIFPSRQ
jgi:microcystin-dependent protein